MDLLAVFSQTLQVTLPVFAMVFLGILFKRIGWIDAHFISTASALVFRATMPTLIFLSIVRADLDVALQPGLIVYFLGFSVLSFFLAWGWAIWRCPFADRGVFAQGAFRGNCGIVGLALAASQYGDYGLSLGSILAGGIIIVYNVLAAIILAYYSANARSGLGSILKHVARNPLILSVLLAMPFAYFQVPLPEWLMTSGDYFGAMSLPLALVCIGGTLSFSSVKQSSGPALDASLWKIVWIPLLGVLGAYALGYRGRELGMLFLFLGTPGAAASFVMAKAVNANAKLAANIIVITTFASLFTLSAGVFILTIAGWI
ncbi:MULTISPECIES: AEC family transporter [Chromohalobacter]|uniref:AEC family transporter n=1 Tax=Chromohalobacter TaxID=42054 RepID=UPI0015C4353E|nr:MULTISPECIES: AEC family transporter [Chromohalobacter]MDO0947208.1 AEC family transporter [Chromohalobacter salexigens]NQY46554.1 AEC family transporter [Chromohalobacter sp.]NWO57511.1 AEC family transporter [Chromohalobacter salexigens]